MDSEDSIEQAKARAEEVVQSALAKAEQPTPPQPTTEAVVTTTAAVVSKSDEAPQVTAENGDEMGQCQSTLIDWCRKKVRAATVEHADLEQAHEHSVKHKWKSDTLKRHAGLAQKRLDFYEKVLSALERGYQIVPSFPVTAFAIRTDREKPLRIYTQSHYMSHMQEAQSLPEGEGEWKNPFPVVRQRTIANATSTTNEVCAYWADAWKDLEFPLSMAKPQIMEATTRAMALKIFDDIGILPGFSGSEGTTPPRGDPIIVARIKYPRMPKHAFQPVRFLTFIVAWHLNLNDL